jgi:hypothetical protein
MYAFVDLLPASYPLSELLHGTTTTKAVTATTMGDIS